MADLMVEPKYIGVKFEDITRWLYFEWLKFLIDKPRLELQWSGKLSNSKPRFPTLLLMYINESG